MKGLEKSKRVTWARGANLCQVKLFLLEDCPSKVCVGAQHRHQTKTLNPNIWSFNFPAWHVPLRGRDHVDSFKGKLSRIPQIKWKSPPEFSLDIKWCVAAGEESREVQIQEDRQTKVLAAVYPHLSAIPPSPCVSLDEEDQFYDDRCTPVIPIISLEEAEGAAQQLPSDETPPPILPMNSNPPAISQGPHLPATNIMSQYTMNSQALSHSLGPSTSAGVTITSNPLTMSQGPSMSASSIGPHHTRNSPVPSSSYHPDTSTTASITHCMMTSQLPPLSECPSTSATVHVSQPTIMSKLPSLPPSSTTSATSYITQLVTSAQPVSISQLPSASASPFISNCNMNSQPQSLPRGPPTLTSVPVSHCYTTGSLSPPVCEKSLTCDGLDGHVVDAVAAAAIVMAKCKEAGSLIDTDLLIKILSDPKMIEKLREGHGLASNTEPKTACGYDAGPSLVSSLSSVLDSSIKKATTEHSETPNSQTQARSRSAIASQSLALPSRKTEEVISKSIKQEGIATISVPVRKAPLLPSHSRMPDVLPGKLFEGHVRAYSVIDSKGTSRPVIPTSFPSSKTEVLPGKSIESHGERHAGTSCINGLKPAEIPARMPPSNLGASSINNFKSSKDKGESACTTTQAISWPDTSHRLHSLPSSKDEVVDKKLIEEHGWSRVAPGAQGTNPMANTASFLRTKPEVRLDKTSVNEYKSPTIAGTVNISVQKLVEPLVPRTVGPDMEKLKELISEYGTHENAGQKSFASGRQDVQTFKEMVVNGCGVPYNAGRMLFPSERQNADMFKNMMSGYGGPNNEPVQKSLTPGRQNAGMIKKTPSEYGTPDHTGYNKFSFPAPEPTFAPFSRTKSDMSASPRCPDLPWKAPPPFSSPAPPLKDMNYYKSLIMQHGENHETSDDDGSRYLKLPHSPWGGPQLVQQDLKPTEHHNDRSKIPCMFFKSPRGCRRGTTCPYLHDDKSKLSRPGSNLMETTARKRVKLLAGNS